MPCYSDVNSDLNKQWIVPVLPRFFPLDFPVFSDFSIYLLAHATLIVTIVRQL